MMFVFQSLTAVPSSLRYRHEGLDAGTGATVALREVFRRWW
jgi:hypothetical protein